MDETVSLIEERNLLTNTNYKCLAEARSKLRGEALFAGGSTTRRDDALLDRSGVTFVDSPKYVSAPPFVQKAISKNDVPTAPKYKNSRSLPHTRSP